MKKMKSFILVLISIFCLTGCSFNEIDGYDKDVQEYGNELNGQEQIILEEIDKIYNSEDGSIDMNIKTTGDYAKVELAAKEYFVEELRLSNLINENCAQNTFYNYSGEFLGKNRYNLKNMDMTKIVNDNAKIVADNIDLLLEMKKDEEILKFLHKYELGNKYDDFFIAGIKSTITSIHYNILYEFRDSNVIKTEALIKLYDYLADNPELWGYRDDQLFFTNESLKVYNKYYDIICDE